jgi:ABC-2 type transport system ATP-binding protein
MIHVEKLTKYYGDLCAVDQIDLDIHKGEITGLLGPNGAGKTTTLRMLTGYLLPSSGGIQVKDFSIEDDMLQIKKLIGYLPESAPLYHNMLVYDYLDYVAKVRGLDKQKKVERIHELADICGLTGIMHKGIGELSKGLKQRVGLAHAMMDDPEILVLDEPTSGLDPNQIVEIRDIIRRIGREKTIILSTHILSEAEATCDRIVIIDHGKIVADGSTETLKKTSGKEKIINISLIGADMDAAKERLAVIEGVASIERIEATQPDELRLKISASSEDDIRGAVYRSIRDTDWTLVEFHQEGKSLEKIFRELTKEN